MSLCFAKNKQTHHQNAVCYLCNTGEALLKQIRERLISQSELQTNHKRYSAVFYKRLRIFVWSKWVERRDGNISIASKMAGFNAAPTLIKVTFILVIVAFILHIIGFFTPYWQSYEYEGYSLDYYGRRYYGRIEGHSGLWRGCSKTGRYEVCGKPYRACESLLP